MRDADNKAKPTYSSYTYDSPNKLKRAIHRNRYENILQGLRIDGTTKILDYGSGDGRLFRIMIDQHGANPENLTAFDPISTMQEEFSRLVPESRIFGDSSKIPSPADGVHYDYIFCCEVFEHLLPDHTSEALADLKRFGSAKTVYLIEVPIEIGPIAMLKNIYRRFASKENIPASLIAKSLFGIRHQRQPRYTSEGASYDHPGYSFHETRRALETFMTIEHEFNDPFRRLPFVVNNSHIFVARLK